MGHVGNLVVCKLDTFTYKGIHVKKFKYSPSSVYGFYFILETILTDQDYKFFFLEFRWRLTI